MKETKKTDRVFLKETGSSLFAFQDFLTLVSYIPKPKTAVILVSTHHHLQDIDKQTGKPQIIMDYNKNKG